MGLLMFHSAAPARAFFTTIGEFTHHFTIIESTIVSVEAPFEKEITSIKPDQSLSLCYQFISESDDPGFDEPAMTVKLSEKIIYETSFSADKKCIQMQLDQGYNVIQISVHDTIDTQNSPQVVLSDFEVSATAALPSQMLLVFDSIVEQITRSDDSTLVSFKLAVPMDSELVDISTNYSLALYEITSSISDETIITTNVPIGLNISAEPDHPVLISPHQPLWNTFLGQKFVDSRFPNHSISFVTARIPHGHWFAQIHEE